MPQDLRVCIFGLNVDHKYLMLCLALALWGVGQGAGPVVEALLADSTPTGQLISTGGTTLWLECVTIPLRHGQCMASYAGSLNKVDARMTSCSISICNDNKLYMRRLPGLAHRTDSRVLEALPLPS